MQFSSRSRQRITLSKLCAVVSSDADESDADEENEGPDGPDLDEDEYDNGDSDETDLESIETMEPPPANTDAELIDFGVPNTGQGQNRNDLISYLLLFFDYIFSESTKRQVFAKRV